MKPHLLLLSALLASGSVSAPAGNRFYNGTMTVDGKVREIPREIEVIFDRHKGGFYALYGRALRESPRLAGKVVFDFDIAAGGNVTDCRVVSSELTPDLDSKMCARLRQINFGPQKAPSTVRKPIEFFPA